MDDDGLSNDASFRAGVLLGRQQSLTDVMDLLLNPRDTNPTTKIASMLKWCEQTRQELAVESELAVAALRDRED